MASSAATKRKHVIGEFLDFEYPNLSLGQEIAKIHANSGNYLFQVITQKIQENTPENLENGDGEIDVHSQNLENLEISNVAAAGDFVKSETASKNKKNYKENEKIKQDKLHKNNLPLASMPNKFRKTVYVTRGRFIYVEPIEEGNKIKYEIVRILNSDHIKRLYLENLWPECFLEAVDVKVRKEQEDKQNKKLHQQNNNLVMQNVNSAGEEEVYSDSETESIQNEYFDHLEENPNRKLRYVPREETSSSEEFYETDSEEEEREGEVQSGESDS